MTSGNTTLGPTQPPETTSGNTRTGRPRHTLDLPDDLAAELAAFTDRLASATDLGAATINNRLAAVDAFFALRGSGRPAVVREHLARPSAPRALDQRTLLRFLRTVARDASPRDRAICHLAYYTGLRIAEIVALDVADIRLSARKGSVRVRGKGRLGGKDRTVPLHAQVRTTLEELLDELGRPTAGPLIRNRDGAALSTRAANAVVSALGAAAGIGPTDDGEAFGPHVLRHTFGTDLVRGRGDLAAEPVDVVLVAELMGHADLNTTRRYALPTETDKARALEALTIDR
ncbi:tyrosine-type recombinase/integrase (plasmid) [Nocardiopsis flavescens]|nr:tyrosine-type recombinase/integrase [Nocardiopsis flavescens]